MAVNIATNLLAFILVLGFLVFAHEAGHFFLAKLFKVRVLVFSFGFGKRLFGFKKGDTDYRVSLIPLGGYVRMAGDTPEEEHDGSPDEYLSKPKWQRFLILVAGPGINILIAVVFLAGLFMIGTEVYKDQPAVLGDVIKGKPAESAGLRPGDQIIKANGEEIRTFQDLRLAISMNATTPVKLEVRRDGKVLPVTLIPERQMTDYGVAGFAGIAVSIDPEVGRVLKDSAAERAGLKTGDRITAINGQQVQRLNILDTLIDPKKPAPIQLQVQRQGSIVDLTLPAMKPDEPSYPGFTQPTVIRKLSPTQAVRQSVVENVKMVKYTFLTIGRLFRGRGSVKELSGPISIARISGEMLRTGWIAVISLMASISLQLGIMNMLPVPVLDGGHIFILLVEGIARRDLSNQVKERIQQLGFVALAVLMIFVLYNDVIQNVMLMRRG